VRTDTGGMVVVGEYGHATFAPTDELEVEIWRCLRARFGRVSIERVLSGPGLLNIYEALCIIEGSARDASTPAAVSVAARSGDPLAKRAGEIFCGALGSVAGDVALCFGARGGVYIAGGVAMQLLTTSYDEVFRRHFEDKGRFKTYLAEIPAFLIQDGEAALLGAARAMAAFAQSR
jgi:glucokinase